MLVPHGGQLFDDPRHLEHRHDSQADEETPAQDQADADEPVGAKFIGKERRVHDERVPGAKCEGKIVAGGGNLEVPRLTDRRPDDAKANGQVAEEHTKIDITDVADMEISQGWYVCTEHIQPEADTTVNLCSNSQSHP